MILLLYLVLTCSTQDKLQRQHVESLNNLSSFIYNLRDQIKDKEGLGGKLSQKNKHELSTAVEEGLAWIDQYGPNALLEDIEEKLTGKVFNIAWPHAVLT